MVPRGEGLSNVAFDCRDGSIVRPWRYALVILELASLRPLLPGPHRAGGRTDARASPTTNTSYPAPSTRWPCA